MSLPSNVPPPQATSAPHPIQDAQPLCKQIAEMAEILGVGAGTVRTRLWRALDRLRNALEL